MTSDRPSRLTSGSASSSFKSRSSNMTCMAFMWMIHTHPSRGSKHRNRMNADSPPLDSDVTEEPAAKLPGGARAAQLVEPRMILLQVRLDGSGHVYFASS